MQNRERMAGAAELLLQRAQLSPTEVEERFAQALDPGYWRGLAPFARLGEPAKQAADLLAAEDTEREKHRFDADGYFRLPRLLAPEDLDRLRRTVDAVRAAGWPAVFAFVFDDFWSIARSDVLLDFVSSCLGGSCLQNTVIWAHWVPAIAGSAGWHPHVDIGNGDGGSHLSIWVALSDATVDNGCIFLVRPSGITPEINRALEEKSDIPYAQYRHVLQNVVALPTAAGSAIGWRGDVLHWGGVNSGGAVPRMSLALEFRPRGWKPTKFEAPLIDPRDGPPPLDLRLFAIAKALRTYARFEPIVSRFHVLAERLWQETKPDS